MELTRARMIAEHLVALLAPGCERIEIAGSIRRQKPTVKDIEIVAIPRLGKNLFDIPDPDLPTELDGILAELQARRVVLPGRAMGPRYSQFLVPSGPINLDLFVVLPPATWGVIFALRTGPEFFSRWCVTSRRQGGGLPSDLQVKDGQVLRPSGGEVLSTPEEKDFFAALALPFIPPDQRATYLYQRGGR